MARHALDGEPGDIAAAPGAPQAGHGVGPDAPARKVRRAQRPPGRSCIVTREVKDPAELIRFVLSPANVVTPDIGRSLPGRGVWVTARRAFLAQAVKRKAFARAFRKDVAVPADLADLVADLLRKSSLQALSLANKAGAVTCGFEKVKAALATTRVLALIEASDGSPEGRRKLVSGLPPASADHADGMATRDLPVIDVFASDDLDLALGRSHVIHAALLEAPAGRFALSRCLRFRRFELIEELR